MGQLVVNAIKLFKDMISYDGKVHLLEGTDDFFEGRYALTNYITTKMAQFKKSFQPINKLNSPNRVAHLFEETRSMKLQMLEKCKF